MGHTPYGYRIENGKAVIDKEKAQQIRNLYKNYLDGMALAKAAHEAGIQTWHGSAKRLLENRHYLGDDYYPAIIDQQTYDKAQAERLHRAEKLGRTNRKKQSPDTRKPPTHFKLAAPEQAYDDTKQQAEYLYSLIERHTAASALIRTNRKPATKRRSPTTRSTSKATRNGSLPESSPTMESAAQTRRSVTSSTA